MIFSTLWALCVVESDGDHFLLVSHFLQGPWPFVFETMQNPSSPSRPHVEVADSLLSRPIKRSPVAYKINKSGWKYKNCTWKTVARRAITVVL
jgi:hypothetical protein